MKHRLYTAFLLLIIVLSTGACKKSFLDKKPDKALLIPETLSDVKQLLDNSEQLFNNSPGFTVMSGDEYVTDGSTLLNLPAYERNSYLWEKEVYPGERSVEDWRVPYVQVFYANIALETLAKINPEQDRKEWNRLNGIALFYRGFAFYNLTRQFAAQYDPQTAQQLPGIPLRLESDVNSRSVRASLQESYNQVIKDVAASKELLLLNEDIKTRPDKKAAYALLARISLSMEAYSDAGKYADSCLALKNDLLDYNTVDTTGTARPFPNILPVGNKEMLFFSGIIRYDFPSFVSTINITPKLYQSYSNDDLRRPLFFRNVSTNKDKVMRFRGTYTGPGNGALFNGLATDEMYLIKAECLVRADHIQEAMLVIDELLVKRWKTGTYTKQTAGNKTEALQIVLNERKKELICRGLRWDDLKRLNKDPLYAVELTREVNGKIYTLKPNDLRYVFPIPDHEISRYGMAQNPR